MAFYPTNGSSEMSDSYLRPRVSVIVPAYNVAKCTLARSVGSALEQVTHECVEVIVVDDGSLCPIDTSVAPLTDPRVRVFRTKNRGVSAARNHGMRLAQGEYIAFLDADDELLPHFVAESTRIADDTGADVVVGSILLDNDGVTTVWRTDDYSQRPRVLSQSELSLARSALLSASPSPTQTTPIWLLTNVVAALYRTQAVSGFQFPADVHHCEDRIFNLQVVCSEMKIVACATPWYRYDRSSDCSATQQVTLATARRIAPTVAEYAGLGGYCSIKPPTSAHPEVGESAAQGVLNQMKLLATVLAASGTARRTSRAILLRALAQEGVLEALSRRRRTSFRDAIVGKLLLTRSVTVLQLITRFWVKSRRGQVIE